MKKNNVKHKILLISNMYPSELNPNYGVFVKNTEDILIKNNYIVDKIVITKENNKIKKVLSYLKHYFNIIKFGIIGDYKTIYVHYASHNSIPILILTKLKHNVNICTNLHGSDVVPEKWIHEKFQPYVDKLLKKSRCIIVPSNYYKDKVTKKYNIETAKIKVFPSGGINKEYFYEKKSSSKKKYIGIVGRIEYKKGWDVFLKFICNVKELPMFKEYKFIVVGDGNQRQEFYRLVEELEIEDRIEKYNMISQESLNDIYNKMEVLCFPTMREGESLGLVGLEAMACGTPVIGSNIGGLKDYIIDNKNGYLFEPGNVEDLTNKMIEYIMKSEDEKICFKKSALETAERYEVNKISSKLINIFEEI